MRISTRGRYGLRAMFELARRQDTGPVTMDTVAQEQELSRKHLHNLLTALKVAGLVQSIRGPRGGFVLTRPPEQIRLSEILEAVEGPLSLVACVVERDTCRKTRSCPARQVWQQVSDAIEEVLESVTLHDMVAPQDNARAGGATGKKKGRPGNNRQPAAKRKTLRRAKVKKK